MMESKTMNILSLLTFRESVKDGLTLILSAQCQCFWKWQILYFQDLPKSQMQLNTWTNQQWSDQKKNPKLVLRAKKKLARSHRSNKHISKSGHPGHPPSVKPAAHTDAKREYRAAVRRSRVQASRSRDMKLFTILEENPGIGIWLHKILQKSYSNGDWDP